MDGVSDVRNGDEGEGGDTSTRVRREVRWAIAGAVEQEINRCSTAGVPFPTLAVLASRLGTSTATVCRTLVALEGARRIDRQSQKYDRRNLRYRVLPDGGWTAWRPSLCYWGAESVNLVSQTGAVGGLGVLASDSLLPLADHVTTVAGMATPWSELFVASGASPRELTISGDLGVTGKVSSPQPDLPSILRDRRAALAAQRYKIGLAIEHIDGLLHFLAPDGDGSEVEKSA